MKKSESNIPPVILRDFFKMLGPKPPRFVDYYEGLKEDQVYAIAFKIKDKFVEEHNLSHVFKGNNQLTFTEFLFHLKYYSKLNPDFKEIYENFKDFDDKFDKFAIDAKRYFSIPYVVGLFF